MANISDVLIKLLGEAKVQHIFGVPGDAINSLTEAIRIQDKIKFIHVNHEETGSFAASATAKLTGNLGVCCGTAGPGAIHLLNGLYDAKTDNAPVLAITGQVESNLIGSNYHQEVNLHALFSDVAVYNQVVTDAEQFPYMAVQAITAALQQRGVAHLNIPVDIASKQVPNPDKWKLILPQKVLSCENDESICIAAHLINQNNKIVILAGIGCSEAVDEVYAFAEFLSAPIVHALKAKELFLENHPFSIGGIGALGEKASVEAFSECDLIILIGTDFPYFNYYPQGKKVIQIDIDANRIGRRIAIDIGLVGDAKITLRKLLSFIKPKLDRGFLESAQQNKRKWQKEVQDVVSDKSNPIKPQRLAYLVGQMADENAIIVCDTGLLTGWTARYFKMKKGQRFTLSGSLATMAYGLGAAIGAKLAYPERQVICVIGDGGFSMAMNDFITAVKHRLKIIFVIFNNSKLGLITLEQEANAGVPDYETDMCNPDFAMYAKLCGGGGILVTKENQLDDALDQASKSTLPFIVNVMIDDKVILMPPKISLHQIYNYGKAKIKEKLL